MNKEKAEEIVAKLLINASGLRYGAISFTARVHDGRVFEVSYTKTEQTREKEPQKKQDQ